VELRKTSLLPNIRDDAINAPLGITHGNISYAAYTPLFNDFLPRSRQPLRDDLQCIRFISGMAKFQLHTQAKSHRLQKRGYVLYVVELQSFLNDIVTDSPQLGRARSTSRPSTTAGGGQPTKKRTYKYPLVEASKI
jgi:hypothetical protein